MRNSGYFTSKKWSYGPLLTNRFLGPLLEEFAGRFQSPESSSKRKGKKWKEHFGGFHHGFGFKSRLIQFQVFYDRGGGRKDLFDLGYFR